MAAVRVQSQVGDNAAGTGTIVLTPTSPTTAGNLLVCLIGQYGGAPAAPSITDSAVQAWTTTAPALSSSPRGSLRGSIYYMPNSVSVTSVTVTPSNVASAILLEYSGVDTAPTVVAVSAFTDQVGVASFASNAINTTKTSLLIGVAWDIFLANAGFAASGAWSAGGRFNNATDGDDAWFEEQLSAAAASGLTAAGTNTSSEISAGIIAFSLPTATVNNPLPLLSPLTGLGIPGRPPVSQQLPTGVEQNALGYVTPLPISQFLNPLSLAMGPVLFPIPAPYVLPVPGTTFNDSGSGTITLSGSGTETQTHSQSASGTITLSGSSSQSQTHTGSGSGTITLSGTGTQSASFVDSRAGTITLSGTGTQSQTHTASGAGTVTLAGASAQSQTHSSSATGTITLSGFGTENYVPPGAPTQVVTEYDQTQEILVQRLPH